MRQQDDDVTTFSGFGSWMSTFTPQPAPQDDVDNYTNTHQQYNVHELDNHYHDYHEMDAGKATAEHKNHHIAELPDHHRVPQPYPPQPYPPQPNRGPLPYPVYPVYPEPVPAPLPYPIDGPKPKPRLPVVNKKKDLETKEVVFLDVPDPVCRVEVQGLVKAGQKGMFTEVVTLSSYGFLDDIAEKLRSFGYRIPLGFGIDTQNAQPLSVPIGFKEAPWPIIITLGKSCYDPDIGLRIHVDEPFSVFLARVQLSVKCTDSRIVVNGGDLKIAFHRTLRVPEDGRTHKLPASFGRFPVENVAAYSKKLVGSKNDSLLDMAKKGGVFFPIFQREAMWLSFRATEGSEYKVRVFVGGVNVVTGKKWDDDCKSDSPYSDKEQDYILVPPQKHLDGIATGNGIVRQFVAMPIGSGYSIEKQITGKEDVGGLQLEITARNRHLHFYYRGRDIQWQDDDESGNITTPRTYGLRPGQMMTMMRSGPPDQLPFLGGKIRKEQKKTLLDLLDPISKGRDMSTATITALYPVSLQIKMPGTLMKHKITTPVFSPFDTIDKVIKETRYKGKDLGFFTLFYDEGLYKNDTLVGAGLHDGAVLDAYKNYQDDPNYIGAAPGNRPQMMDAHDQIAPDDSINGFSRPAPTLLSSNSASPQTGYHRQSYNSAPTQLSAPTYNRPPSYPTPSSYGGPQTSYETPSSYNSSPPTSPYPTQTSLSPQSAPQPSYLSSPSSHSSSPATSHYSPPTSSPHARFHSQSLSPPPKPVQQEPKVESWTMGLAAGGRLAQQIHLDTTPPAYRSSSSPAATALVSVQLLNAVAYETLTGMLCPPTPITAKEYMDAGIPWFDTYVGGKGGAGAVDGGRAFETVKSVGELDASSGPIYADTSVAASQKVACSVCRRNLCDCVIRPCNHAFCGACVMGRMVQGVPGRGSVVRCAVCREIGAKILGFSAPMALPGQEDWVPDLGADVVVKAGCFGKGVVFELE
ncbi:Nn.00g104610.m01.CDS01 [Neocucurbitaria sp. VM-36]